MNPSSPERWLVSIEPSALLEEEWQDEQGNTWQRYKPGWGFVARRKLPFAVELGSAESFEECRRLAEELIRTRDISDA